MLPAWLLVTFQPQQHGGDDDTGAVVTGPLVVASGNRAPLLEPVGAPLDHVALPIAVPVEGRWATASAGALV